MCHSTYFMHSQNISPFENTYCNIPVTLWSSYGNFFVTALMSCILLKCSPFMVVFTLGKSQQLHNTRADENENEGRPQAKVMLLEAAFQLNGTRQQDSLYFLLHLIKYLSKKTSRTALESGKSDGISLFKERGYILRDMNGNVSFVVISSFKHS